MKVRDQGVGVYQKIKKPEQEVEVHQNIKI